MASLLSDQVRTLHVPGLKAGTQTELQYQLRRRPRRSIGFTVDPNGLRVNAPMQMSIAQLESAIRSKSHWILSKLAHWQNRPAAPGIDSLPAAGETIPLFGIPLRLVLQPGPGRGVQVLADRVAGTLTLHAPERVIDSPLARNRVLEDWLRQQARLWFGPRLMHFAAQVPRPVRDWGLSRARTRWGSCNASGRILLNWRLVHYPESVIDYVIAHEVAHLIEMNHGPRFWAIVARLVPDHREAQAALKLPPVASPVSPPASTSSVSPLTPALPF